MGHPQELEAGAVSKIHEPRAADRGRPGGTRNLGLPAGIEDRNQATGYQPAAEAGGAVLNTLRRAHPYAMEIAERRAR